jgi:hypothetical protein
MGFKLAKVEEISRILMEKTDNVIKRRNYLREKDMKMSTPNIYGSIWMRPMYTKSRK